MPLSNYYLKLKFYNFRSRPLFFRAHSFHYNADRKILEGHQNVQGQTMIFGARALRPIKGDSEAMALVTFNLFNPC